MFLPRKIIEEKLLAMLAEDLGQGDVTTSLLIPGTAKAQAIVVAKEKGVAAGIEEAKILLTVLGLKAENFVADGENIKPKQTLLKVSGDACTILAAERTLLNILSRMSGIAMATRNLVEKLRKAKSKTRIACTRKMAPGLMYFDKKAVLIGGGDTHRLHLDDMVLIKDNHLALVGSVGEAVKKAKGKVSFSKKIEVEVTRIEDVLEAVEAGADIIMLDNFSTLEVKKTVALLKEHKYDGKVLLEVSGGITAGSVLELSLAGVDVISLGELTHSPRALNVSLEILKNERS